MCHKAAKMASEMQFYVSHFELHVKQTYLFILVSALEQTIFAVPLSVSVPFLPTFPSAVSVQGVRSLSLSMQQ